MVERFNNSSKEEDVLASLCVEIFKLDIQVSRKSYKTKWQLLPVIH